MIRDETVNESLRCIIKRISVITHNIQLISVSVTSFDTNLKVISKLMYNAMHKFG